MKLILVVLLLILLSCSPPKQLARIEKNHPELFKKDTVTRTDTFISKEVSKDTVFNSNQSDTVILHSGKLTIKYLYLHDSVYLQGLCTPDTFIKKVSVIVDRSIIIPKKINWYKWVLFTLGFLIFSFFIFRTIKLFIL